MLDRFPLPNADPAALGGNRNFSTATPQVRNFREELPRSEAAAHLQLVGRGDALDVDGERIYFRLGTMKHVRDFAAAVSGQASEPEG